MTPDIEKLLKIIEQKLSWGESETWQSRDFENLNQLILDETSVSLSASTLRRIWGRVEYKHLPSGTSLDTLAKFAGYENWRSFVKLNADSDTNLNKTELSPAKPYLNSRPWIKIALVMGAVIAVGLKSMFAFKKVQRPINADDYAFSSLRLTREIPNSVIFTYDATASPTDSIYIQQSWDPRTKTLVDKNLHKHTSAYRWGKKISNRRLQRSLSNCKARIIKILFRSRHYENRCMAFA